MSFSINIPQGSVYTADTLFLSLEDVADIISTIDSKARSMGLEAPKITINHHNQSYKADIFLKKYEREESAVSEARIYEVLEITQSLLTKGDS